MSGFRVVKCLDQLHAQINVEAPGRATGADGTLGDQAHALEGDKSDHNPHLYPALGPIPVVCAEDITQDPAHGVDGATITEALRESRDPRIKYVIFNRRIFSNHSVTQGGKTYAAWQWRPYLGDDPHTGHFHVSVVGTAIADSTAEWSIGMALTTEEHNWISAIYYTLTTTDGDHAGDGGNPGAEHVRLAHLKRAVAALSGPTQPAGGLSAEQVTALVRDAVRQALRDLVAGTLFPANPQ